MMKYIITQVELGEIVDFSYVLPKKKMYSLSFQRHGSMMGEEGERSKKCNVDCRG